METTMNEQLLTEQKPEVHTGVEDPNQVPQTNTKEDPVQNSSVEGSPLECNICYEESDEPVTTPCGHIYCWACIYKWVEIGRGEKKCPVCKSSVSQEKLIPLYPKNYTKEKTHGPTTTGVPKRPYAIREERNSSLYTGVNIRMQNLAITIGCIPAILPFFIFVAMTFMMIFLDDDEVDTTDHYSGEPLGSATYEDDYQEGPNWGILFMMVLFVLLPFIMKRIQRRNNN